MENFSNSPPSKEIIEREHYVAKVYRSLGLQDKLKARWKEIKYTPPIPEQLKMNL